jgi:hypothetical protein
MKRQTLAKKMLSILLILLVCLGLTVFVPGSSFAQVKKIKVTVDPRIELITIVQYMVGYWPMSRLDTSYATEVQEKFGPYWEHPVLRQYMMMWFTFGFGNDAPHDVMLHLSEPPELQVRIPFPKELIERAGGEKALNDFLDLLRDYAKKTKFMDFFEDHQEYYKFHVEDVSKQIEKEDYVGLLEGYYGSSNNSYALILASLLHEGGYGVNVGGTMYAIIGPSRSIDREPVFSDPTYLSNLAFHEFGNSFISPLSSKIREDIKRCQKLIQPIQLEMEQLAYPTWEICMNEHLIRAITIRILAPKNGEIETKKKIQEQYNSYFVYIDYVLGMLDEYENNRDLYPNFFDFYPKIQAMFEELCEYPLIPTFLKTDYASQNGVQISWRDNSADESEFVIYRKELGDLDFIEIDKVPANQSHYRDNQSQIGKTYQYVISALGEKGEIFSNKTEAKIIPIRPISPKKLSVKISEDKTKITLTWKYPFYCDGFKVYDTTTNRVLIGESTPDKPELILDIPALGEHTYVVTAWINGEKDKILESFDSKAVVVTIE